MNNRGDMLEVALRAIAAIIVFEATMVFVAFVVYLIGQ